MFLHEFRVGRLRCNKTLACRAAGARSCGRLSRGTRVCLSRFLKLFGTRIHGGLDFGKVHLDIVQHALLKGPTEEVQLSHSCLEHRITLDLEHDSLTPAEGIEQFFTVCLQLGFVVRIHKELLVIQDVGNVVLLGIVRDKPVNQAQGYFRCSLEEFQNLLFIVPSHIESL